LLKTGVRRVSVARASGLAGSFMAGKHKLRRWQDFGRKMGSRGKVGETIFR
jgi:hypothetical protein